MATKQPNDYVNNAKLLPEILKSQANQAELPKEERNERAAECLTPELVNMLMQLVQRYATSYRWRGYTWNEDMQSEALMNLCKVALKFDLEKAGDYPNPFGYYTQIVKRVFLTYIDKEKKQGRIRDEIIEMSETELLPSFGRQAEEENNQMGVDLDGTKRVESDPRRRKRKKTSKKKKVDDTSKMTDAEYQRWLEAKKDQFLATNEVTTELPPETDDETDDGTKER